MRRPAERFWLALGLIGLSAALYAANYAITGRGSDIFFYTLLDLSFMPIELLIVGVIIDQILKSRERRALLHKLNMVVGAFFSEMGSETLRTFASFQRDAVVLCDCLKLRTDWGDADLRGAQARLKEFSLDLDAAAGDLEALRAQLTERRGFMLRLLENPNLLEHETFTDLLWAVTHLAEELAARGDLTNLSSADRAHLTGDMERAWRLLVAEWLSYLRHLRSDYPYLFSLAVRTNPFDFGARVEID